MKGAVDVLLDRGRMCLMPEGNQGHQHKLRPLVKGLVRIAYMAEEQLKDEAHVNIIPIGIDYNYYRHAGSDLVVTYGQPIEVKDSIEAYKENQANGLNLLREKLAESLSSLMHDIRSATNYDRIYWLCCLGTPAYLQVLLEKGAETEATTLAGLRFDARRNLGLFLDRLEMENPDQVDTWDRLCQNLKKLPGSPAEVSEWMDERRGVGFSALFAILTLILLPGLLLNLPAWLVARFACSMVEDTQMHSTFSFVLGMFVNALVYILVATFICLTMQVPWMLSIVTFIFVFAFGSVCERVRQSMRLHWRRLWYSFGERSKLLAICKEDYEKLRVSMMEYLRK